MIKSLLFASVLWNMTVSQADIPYNPDRFVVQHQAWPYEAEFDQYLLIDKPVSYVDLTPFTDIRDKPWKDAQYEIDYAPFQRLVMYFVGFMTMLLACTLFGALLMNSYHEAARREVEESWDALDKAEQGKLEKWPPGSMV